jgi:hypothetical protein
MSLPILGWAGLSWNGEVGIYPERGELSTEKLGRPPRLELPPLMMRETRRASRFDKLVLAAAWACLDRAGGPGVPPSRFGIFMGTNFGSMSETHDFYASLWDDRGEFVSPTTFVNMVSNRCLHIIAGGIGSPRETLVFSQEDISFEAALASAALRLELGELDRALVVGADAYCGPEDFHRSRLFGDRDFSDVPLGEGAGAVLLGRGGADAIADLDAPRLSRIAPPASAADPSEIASASPWASGSPGACSPWLEAFGYFPTVSALELCAWLDQASRGPAPKRYSRVSASASGEYAPWSASLRDSRF